MSLSHLRTVPQRRRTLLELRTVLDALTAQQKTNVWNALIAGSPPLYQTNAGPHAGALLVLHFYLTTAVLLPAQLAEGKLRAAVLYTADNPRWLEKPAFDPTINVLGFVTLA